MKKINKIIVSCLVLIVILSSCDDELEIAPFDFLTTETAFLTSEDFENGIRGAYNMLLNDGYADIGLSHAYYGAEFFSIPDVLSDNVILAQSGRNTKKTFFDWSYNANSTYRNLYRQTYRVILASNIVISGLEDFDGDDDFKNNLLAEARALRALAHFDNVKTFSKIPTQTSDANTSLGIPFMTEGDPNIAATLTQPRETVGFIYDRIIEDLVFASNNINISNGDGRLGKNAVNTLLSRAYLYMGKWQKCVTAANLVSENIASRSNFVGVWEDSNDDGIIFSIENGFAGLNISLGVEWSQGSVSNLIPEYAVSFDFYNLFNDDDIRKEAYMFLGQDQDGLNYNAIKKIFGAGNSSNGKVDIKILRAAESRLNKAEALFNLGDEALALSTLDQLRDKRYTTFIGGETGNSLKDAIRLERRLEFAFEFQRFYDLKRWNLPIQRSNFGDLSDGSGTPAPFQNLDANSFKFQLPLSVSSINVNTSLIQNPGY